MITFFPKQIASRAIYIYLGSLAAVTVLFHRFAMPATFIVMGVMWVVGYFMLLSYCSMKWQQYSTKRFLWTLFATALGIRCAWVVFSYFFYIKHTGIPFEYAAADAVGYWEDSVWLATKKWPFVWDYLFTNRSTVSDSGYLLYLTAVCKVVGMYIMPVRLISAVLGAAMVVLIHNLAKRNIGTEAARIAALMACFMPNFIIYCGLHLKEAVMLFLTVAFLERADYLLRSKHYTVFTIAIPVIIAISLFTFRTVLGATALFSLATAIVFGEAKVVGRGKRVVLIAWGVLAVATLWGGTIRTEVEYTIEDRSSNQVAKRQGQTLRGNRWAKYATGTVMAPIMFVLPFPTMVDVDQQYNQQVISGGNYVRTFFGGFVLLAVISALFITKNWRNLTLIGSFVFVYLMIVSMSGFANSERFLLPALPGLLIMAAYGVTQLNAKNYRYVRLWYYVVPVLIFGWAFFKLGSRALL